MVRFQRIIFNNIINNKYFNCISLFYSSFMQKDVTASSSYSNKMLIKECLDYAICNIISYVTNNMANIFVFTAMIYIQVLSTSYVK